MSMTLYRQPHLRSSLQSWRQVPWSGHFTLGAHVLLALVALFYRAEYRVVLASEDCSPKPEWVAATVTVGDQPASVGIDDRAGRAYVLSRGSGTITVLDTGSLEIVATWEVGSDPVALAVSSRDSTVYIVRRHGAQSTLLMIDGGTGAVRGSKQLEIVASDIAVRPSGGLVYVVGWDGGQIRGGESSNGAIVAIDGTSGQVAALRLLGGPFFRYQAVAVAPSGGRVYVTWTERYGRNGIEVFDGLRLDRMGSLSPSGDHAFSGLAFDRSGRRLFLATIWRWIDVVDIDLPLGRPRDPAEGELLLGRIDAGRPSRMVYDEDTKILYATRWPLSDVDESSRELVVIDTRSLEPLGAVAVGLGHHSIALDTASHRIFVTNSTDGTVTVVQGVTSDAGC